MISQLEEKKTGITEEFNDTSLSMERITELSKDLATVKEQIEEQLSYPGTIKVTVIRETRAQDIAK